MADEPKPYDRLTVKEIVYHQQFGEQPIQIERSFERRLQTQDSAYHGKPKRVVGTEWEAIDIGWLDQGVGTVHITNDEGKGLQKRATEEEAALIASRVLELCFVDVNGVVGDAGMRLLVPPGESQRLTPSDVSRLRIRSAADSARYSIWLFPR